MTQDHNTDSNINTNKNDLDARQFTVSDPSEEQLRTYRAELRAGIRNASDELANLNREMLRQRDLLQAALAIEHTKKDQISDEQRLLNEIEEQNRQAMLQYMTAKQQIDTLMREYNTRLEHIKHLRTEQEKDAAAIDSQKQHIQSLLNDWQQQNFYLQKQQHLEQKIEQDIAAGTADISSLPPLADLAPKKPEPTDTPDTATKKTSVRSTTPHANAGFWDSKKHTALDPEKLRMDAATANKNAANKNTADTTKTDADSHKIPNKKPHSRLKTLLSYAICLLLSFLLAVAIRTWVITPTHIAGTSMLPNLTADDRVVLSPLPYIFGEPERGDIVVFPAPDIPVEDSIYYVKRVIALPGEHIQILRGNVFINDEKLEEPYLDDPYTEGTIDTIVPDGHVFVMGDNRDVSHDSRDLGVSCVPIVDIRGKALWRIYPFDSFGSLYK